MPSLSPSFPLLPQCSFLPRFHLRWHSSVGGTLPLTETTVASNAAGSGQLPSAGAGVHGDGLLDDEAIGNVLADGLARVGVGQLVDLVGVEPDLALAAACDRGRQALLRAEVDPVKNQLLGNVLANVFVMCVVVLAVEYD